MLPSQEQIFRLWCLIFALLATQNSREKEIFVHLKWRLSGRHLIKATLRREFDSQPFNSSPGHSPGNQNFWKCQSCSIIVSGSIFRSNRLNLEKDHFDEARLNHRSSFTASDRCMHETIASWSIILDVGSSVAEGLVSYLTCSWKNYLVIVTYWQAWDVHSFFNDSL